MKISLTAINVLLAELFINYINYNVLTNIMDYWIEWKDHWVYNLIKVDHDSRLKCTLCPPDNAILSFGTPEDYIMRSNMSLHLLQYHEEIAKKYKERHEKLLQVMSFDNPLFVNLICALVNFNEN